VFIKNWNKASYNRACVHAFIDANTGTVYQTLPWNHRGWHGGSGKKGSVNNTHIGVEMCEPSTIKYTKGSSFTCSNLTSARASVKKTYEAAVELFAERCKEFNLNPLGDGVIISHKEGYARGIASNHGDPEHLWKGLGLHYTMNTFRKDVKAALDKLNNTQVVVPETEEAIKPIPVVPTIKVGSTVRVNKGAKTYTGGKIASFVYNRNHIVSSIKNDRVVITFSGVTVAAINIKDLTLIK
jgi:LysM repeat protein